MDRRDAEKKCSQAGEYLVRYSDRQNKYVLTVNWNGQGRHFVIQEIPDVSYSVSLLKLHLLDFFQYNNIPPHTINIGDYACICLL